MTQHNTEIYCLAWLAVLLGTPMITAAPSRCPNSSCPRCPGSCDLQRISGRTPTTHHRRDISATVWSQLRRLGVRLRHTTGEIYGTSRLWSVPP